MNGRNNGSSTTSQQTTASLVQSEFFNTFQQAQVQATTQKQERWFQANYFSYLNLGWRCFAGAVFLLYCKFFKTPRTEEEEHNESEFNPEQKLWFFCSILRPALDFCAIALKGDKYEDFAKIIALASFISYFVVIYLYIKKSINTLGSHLRLLFWTEDRQFSWDRFKFFGSKIGLIFVAEIAVTIACTKLINWLLPQSKANQSENQKQIQESLKGTQIIMTVVSILLFAPVFEELIYRRSILKTSNFHISTVLSSAVIFGLIHLDATKDDTIFHIVPYFLGGLVFAWSYKKYRNIWISIFAHFLHNFTALFSTLISNWT